MAIGFVAAGPTIAGVANLTVEWPGTQSAGNLGILLLETNQTDTVSVTGWTQPESSPQENSGQNHKLSVFLTVATGSDAAVTITDPGNHGIAQILVFSGVDTSAPIEATAGVSPGTNDVSITCPSVNTAVDGCAILHIAGTGRDATLTGQYGSWTNANLTSITDVADDVTGQAGGGGFGAAWGILATAGASGTATAVQNASGIWTAITIALKPAAIGGGNIITTSFAGINLASGSSSTSKLASASVAGSTRVASQSASAKIAAGIVQGATLTLCNMTSGKVGSGAVSAYSPIYGVAVGSKLAPGIVNASAAGYAPMFSASGGAKISEATAAATTLALGSSSTAKIAAGSSASYVPMLGIATGSKVAPGVVNASGSGYAPQFVASGSYKFSSASASAYAPATAAASGSKYGAGSLAGWFGPGLSVAIGAPYVPGADVSIASMAFSLAQRRAAFALAQRRMSFTLNN